MPHTGASLGGVQAESGSLIRFRLWNWPLLKKTGCVQLVSEVAPEPSVAPPQKQSPLHPGTSIRPTLQATPLTKPPELGNSAAAVQQARWPSPPHGEGCTQVLEAWMVKG